MNSSSKNAMYFLLFLGGISETGRYYVAYVYAVEIAPKKYQNKAGLAIFIAFSIAKVLICLYFMLSVSKNWKVMGVIATILSIGSFVVTLFLLPESPRFLNGMKKYEEANSVLRKMQKFNGINPTYKFDL